VTADFIPFPTVRFEPSGCGPIIFNQTAYAAGYDDFLTGLNAYSLSASSCSAYRFSTWASSGGVAVQSLNAAVTAANVTANGTLVATYVLVGGGPVIWSFTVTPPARSWGNGTVILRVNVGGGSGALTFNYTGLPPGCPAVSSSTWSCAPTTPGFYLVHVTVRDAVGGWAATATGVTLYGSQVGGPGPAGPAPSIGGFAASPDHVRVAEAVVLTTYVTGGGSPFQFEYSGLPPGCVSNNSPQLSCLPSQAGLFEIHVTVWDVDGRTANATTNLTVTSEPAGLPSGAVGWAALGATGVAGASIAAWAVYRFRRRTREGP
jgi:hypothetical protein